ncbi:MAG TPA: hypothetical protein VN517_04910 [Terriglobales bacterium]|nr:hypothetical protein [Terriglobales bacterium]
MKLDVRFIEHSPLAIPGPEFDTIFPQAVIVRNPIKEQTKGGQVMHGDAGARGQTTRCAMALRGLVTIVTRVARM